MHRFLLCLALTACAHTGKAPAYRIDPSTNLPKTLTDPDAPLPFDPRVRHGVLSNGMTWYVEPNERPADRAEIRLFMKVGTVLENDDERGVAHYLEHLAFNGTEHFPDQSFITWLERLGMRFGADVNATTGLDETVYQFQIPTDDPENLDRALLMVKDWLGAIDFQDDECVRERGVVLEEWRRSQGLRARLMDATYPYEYFGSRYVDRTPGANEAAISKLGCDAARAFHARWYRPDLAAIAVVGDVDPDRLIKQIIKTFSPIQGPHAPVERPIYTVPTEHPLLISRLTDPELTDRLVRVIYKAASVEENTHGAYRRFLVSQMAFLVLQERLALSTLETGSAWEMAGAFETPLGLLRAGHVVQASPKPGKTADALHDLLTFVRTIKFGGVNQAELDRARRQLQTGLDAYYTERDKTDSNTHIDELGRAFLENEPVPGIPYEYALSKRVLPSLSIDEINAFIRSDRFFPATGRVVEMLGPEDLAPPTDDEVRALVAQTDALTPKTPVEHDKSVPIVDQAPEPGSVVSVVADQGLPIGTFTLSNGVRVLLLSTKIQADEVVVRGFAPGGTHAADRDHVFDAIIATEVAQRSGVGNLDLASLAKKLAGSTVSASLQSETWADTVSGNATVEELPTLFKLLWATASTPRIDPAIYERVMQQHREAVERQQANPSAKFEEAWLRLLWQDHPLAVPWTAADLDNVTLDGVKQAWAERVSDLDDLTLVVVGSVTPDTLLPILEQWVATLPTSPRTDAVVDDGERRVAGPVDERITLPGLPGTLVRVQWHVPWEDTPAARLLVQGVSDILSGRLHETLREELGGTYGVKSTGVITQFPTREAVITIEFQCDPARLTEMLAAMNQIVIETGSVAWPDRSIGVIRDQNAREREADMQSNAWWADAIVGALARGEAPSTLMDFDSYNRELTPEALRQAAATILQPAHRVQLIGSPSP